MMNREPETITISLDEHDIKSLINSVVHQQNMQNANLTTQQQSQLQHNNQQRQFQQTQTIPNTQTQQNIATSFMHQNQLRQQQNQQPTISIIPHQVPLNSVNNVVSMVPSTSTLLTTGTTTIPVVQSITSGSGMSSGMRKRKPKLNQKLGQLSLEEFWPTVLEEVKELKHVDAKNQNLPLARIKKIMKLDENAKMIAAEAPLLFAKACEYFIQELTLRAWQHTEENKRRTLQRSDIVTAISRCDQFDFLIDIVPREEIKPTTTSTTDFASSFMRTENNLGTEVKKTTVTPTIIGQTAAVTAGTTAPPTDPIQYLLQLGGAAGSSVQPVTQIIHPNTSAASSIQTIPLTQQVLSGASALTPISVITPQNILINPQAQANLVNSIQQAANVNAANNQQTSGHSSQPLQLFQSILGPNGEIQNVPITLPQNQLSFIRIQGANSANTNQNQPQFIIQQPTGAIQVASANPSTTTQPSTSQGIFVNQNAIQQVLNKGNINVANFKTN